MVKHLINTDNTAISTLCNHPDANRYLIKVKSVKYAILENYFEQLYRICTENLQLIDYQRHFYSAWENRVIASGI